MSKSVTFTSEALGHLPGVTATVTDGEAAWLLAQGYASASGYATDSAAVLTGSTNAATIVTGGAVVFQVGNDTVSVTLASSDTASAAATKIDTALTGKADAAIVSSKLQVTSTATGEDAYLRVVSGAGTTLANLGLAVGQTANGSDGGPGVSDNGPADTVPDNDLTAATNREDGPGYGATIASYEGQDPGTAVLGTDTAAFQHVNTGVFPAYDFDAGGVDDEPPTFAASGAITPATAPHATPTAVVIKGADFSRVTGVDFGSGNHGTSFSVVDEETIHVTTPSVGAGATVNVILLDPAGNATKTNGFVFS